MKCLVLPSVIRRIFDFRVLTFGLCFRTGLTVKYEASNEGAEL